MENCASFPPVAAPGCRVLILGSMPGVASLRAGQYYAHPRNAFWPILYALWDAGVPDAGWEARVAFAAAHRVAIWDVARTCRRKGSSDASIRDVQANDIPALLAKYPSIRAIFCNGRSAQSMLTRFYKSLAGQRPCALPSTSPAYTMPFGEKLEAWRAVRAAVEQEDA